MKKLMKNSLSTAVAASVASMMIAGTAQAVEFEVWAPDQANSVAGAGLGTDGGYINIWEGTDVTAFALAGADAVANPTPATIGCDLDVVGGTPATPGPCDVNSVFPGNLTGNTSGDTLAVNKIGRLHGMLPDPQQNYFNVNFFGSGMGYVGIMDARTKEAVALFRVTQTNAPSGTGRSVHMSFWNGDGTQLLVANLHGRILERIDITRDKDGNITAADFNKAASLGMGGESAIVTHAEFFDGTNGAGRVMSTLVTSTASGVYDADATSLTYQDSTGAVYCKQDGCGVAGAVNGGRPGNVIVCPIVTSNNKAVVTFGGGGLIIADTDTTPMGVVGGYSNAQTNGAGCGGVEIGGNVYLNAGASASPAGATQSTFTQYQLNTGSFGDGAGSGAQTSHQEGIPAPFQMFSDFTNTKTGGKTTGIFATNTSGQQPGVTSRRDSHGMTGTLTGNYLHTADRIQNKIEVFSTSDLTQSSYSLTGGGCAEYGVTDDVNMAPGGSHQDDPAPDLMATGPNNQFIFVGLRGPVPVTVGHSGQGTCPGVGIIKLDKATHDRVGDMTHVLRAVNTTDTVGSSASNGGVAYSGTERADIHAAAVRVKSQ